ncbi:MAG: hypothetical protein SGILL_001754 [Bacillariaceae sp.]
MTRTAGTRIPSIISLIAAVLLVVSLTSAVQAFTSTNQPQRRQQPRQTSSTSQLSISFGGGNKAADAVSLPRDVKEAVSKCRAATQEALSKRLSRMDIEFPVGTKFGVEKTPAVSKKKKLAAETELGDGGPTRSMLDQSDRELARIFVDMFQPVGGENIVVAFTEESLSDAAKKKWKGDPSAASKIVAMNRSKSKKKKSKKAVKAKGFAAKMAAEVEDDSSSGNSGGAFQLPDNTEVALFVSPGPKELVVIEKVCNEVGMGTLVVLLNARLDKVDNFGTDSAAKLFQQDFEPVFCLSAAPQEEAPSCLLYRSFPGEWVLARKPKVGQPKTLLSQATKPTGEECKAAYESLEVGDLEKNMEDFVDNVAGWFR